MKNKLKISLTEANNKPVSLKSLSPEALESFLLVASSLKAIATSIVVNDELNFVISEGSAAIAIVAPDNQKESIYEELDLLIKGQGDDKEIARNLRIIQTQVKRSNYNYNFTYSRKRETPIQIHKILKESKQISIKRTKEPYVFRIRTMSGLLNLIGGKKPNYHFDYGHRDRLTIDCSVEQAMEINKFLYKEVTALVLCKEWTKGNKKDKYFHRAVLENESIKNFKVYLNAYGKEKDLVKKLTITHDFIDDAFEKSNSGHQTLKNLLLAFNNKWFHLSELKTLLVISKPFRNHELIRDARIALVKTYETKRNK